MKATVIEDAQILIPNMEHKNFTDTGKIIEAGTEVEGEPKLFKGKRRGDPFTYRLFYTTNNQFIHLKKIQPMQTVEVTLGADGDKTSGADAQTTPTKVDLPPTKMNANKKLWGTILFAAAGFAYAKYKKHDMKKSAIYIGIGAAIGYGIGWYLEGRNKIVVQPSK